MKAIIVALATTVASGCAAPEPPAQDDADADAEPAAIALDYLGQPAPGAAPEIFAAGIVSTDEFELNSIWSADGRSFYFTRRVDDIYKIFQSRREANGWSDPEILPFSRNLPEWTQVDMALSPSEDRLYFISNAPTAEFPEESVNIWFSPRGDGGEWLEPELLKGPVNTEGRELYPILVADGSMYFSSEREGGLGAHDIYRAAYEGGAFLEPENLGSAINSEALEGDVFVPADESYLIVASGRDGGHGNLDLYVSFREPDGSWSAAMNLGPEINSAETDYCPVVTPDGRYFFFSRNGDVYWMDAGFLESMRTGS